MDPLLNPHGTGTQICDNHQGIIIDDWWVQVYNDVDNNNNNNPDPDPDPPVDM